MRKVVFLAFLLCFTTAIQAHTLHLRKNAPRSYTVKRGDTLWKIAKTFLRNPWEWQQLWRANPHLKNPDRLYPGAVIKLRYDGKRGPYVRVTRQGTVRLSPHVRRLPSEYAIPVVPLNLIRPFLSNSQVLDQEVLETAPHVVDFAGDHILGTNGSHIFVADLRAHRNQNFSIFRDEGEYREPFTGELLGHHAMHVADAQVVKPGDFRTPATLVVNHIQVAIKPGDRLLPSTEEDFDLYYLPHPPGIVVDGEVIDFLGQYNLVGRNYIVVLDRGFQNGLRVGDVLGIERPGNVILDPVYHDRRLILPDERIAEAMVFRTFGRVSYALVMNSTRGIRVNDLIVNP